MTSRRSFLRAGVGLGTTAAFAACGRGNAPTAEPVNGPGVSSAARKEVIVDSQVHIWKANTPEWPWLDGAIPQLPQPFTVDRAIVGMDEAGIDRAVVVPPILNDRNDYALEAHRAYPDRLAVMGRIPLQDPASAALLPTWLDQEGMLGVRLTFNTPRTETWLSDGTADWFWPVAAEHRIPVMALAFGQTERFDAIARQYPDLRLIIDHMGVNREIASAGRMAEAIDQAVAIAARPNVSIKMSNLPNASLVEYPYPDLTPHLERVFDAFGPERCHWGSDATNQQARGTWKQRLAHAADELDFLSEADKTQVLGQSIRTKLNWT